MKMQAIGSILRRTFSEWSGHNAPRLAAALAFYSLLSMAPLLIFVVAIVAIVYGDAAAQSQILAQVESLMGKEGAGMMRDLLAHAQKPASGIIAAALAIVTLLFGASGVFGELRAALNTMWDVKPPATSGLAAMLKQRAFSFGLVLAVGLLLLAAVIASTALAAFGKFAGARLPLPESALSALNFVISLAMFGILFGLIFRYVPDHRVPWKDVWLGGFVTAFLFVIGKLVIGLYLGKMAVGSPYGAAGSLAVVMIWVYYSSLIFLFGAEFTHVVGDGLTS